LPKLVPEWSRISTQTLALSVLQLTDAFANTKGKLQTRTIPVIEDLRSLLTSWRSHAGQIYLFPGRHPNHHWKHLHTNSADRILREAFERAGIEGASTHSFRRTALTSNEQCGYPAANYSRNQRSQQPRTVEHKLPAVPLPREQVSQAQSDAPEEIPDW
jgi:integrase/recombinase XerD